MGHFVQVDDVILIDSPNAILVEKTNNKKNVNTSNDGNVTKAVNLLLTKYNQFLKNFSYSNISSKIAGKMSVTMTKAFASGSDPKNSVAKTELRGVLRVARIALKNRSKMCFSNLTYRDIYI